jgi:hypothetical protein
MIQIQRKAISGTNKLSFTGNKLSLFRSHDTAIETNSPPIEMPTILQSKYSAANIKKKKAYPQKSLDGIK